MWNIAIGVIFIIGGLSGTMVLKGTQSSGALAVVGLGLVGWGIFQMMDNKGGGTRKTKTRAAPTRPTNRPRLRK